MAHLVRCASVGSGMRMTVGGGGGGEGASWRSVRS
jgi:hypothetical protein